MVLILGGLGAGKREYARSLGYNDAEMSGDAFSDAPVIVEPEEVLRPVSESAGAEPAASVTDMDGLFAALCGKELVLSREVGCGIVPLPREERHFREEAGRLQVRLAKEADSVVRMVAGIPVVIKGEMPCTRS